MTTRVATPTSRLPPRSTTTRAPKADRTGHLSVRLASGAVPQLARPQLLALGELVEAAPDRHALPPPLQRLRLDGRGVRVRRLELLPIDQAVSLEPAAAATKGERRGGGGGSVQRCAKVLCSTVCCLVSRLGGRGAGVFFPRPPLVHQSLNTLITRRATLQQKTGRKRQRRGREARRSSFEVETIHHEHPPMASPCGLFAELNLEGGALEAGASQRAVALRRGRLENLVVHRHLAKQRRQKSTHTQNIGERGERGALTNPDRPGVVSRDSA